MTRKSRRQICLAAGPSDWRVVSESGHPRGVTDADRSADQRLADNTLDVTDNVAHMHDWAGDDKFIGAVGRRGSLDRSTDY